MSRMGYREALQWLLENDDCHYLDSTSDADSGLSVTASLVADIYRKKDEKVREDLLRLWRSMGSD